MLGRVYQPSGLTGRAVTTHWIPETEAGSLMRFAVVIEAIAMTGPASCLWELSPKRGGAHIDRHALCRLHPWRCLDSAPALTRSASKR
jgi:hypothetical protein